MNEVVALYYERLKEIWEDAESAMMSGGTYSSDRLRKSLVLLGDLESIKDQCEYVQLKGHVLEMIDLWRKALKKHNDQDQRFVEYDLETGLPVTD